MNLLYLNILLHYFLMEQIDTNKECRRSNMDHNTTHNTQEILKKPCKWRQPRIFKDVEAIFEAKGCKVTTTRDEFESQDKTFDHRKVKYIATCGHENEVTFTNFVSKGTGIVCKKCVYKQTGLKHAKLEDGHSIIVGQDGIDRFVSSLGELFDIYQTYEGCLVDIIVRPIGEANNLWLPVQVKTITNHSDGIYSFNLKKKNKYENMAIFCYCKGGNKTWLFDGKEIKSKSISIGLTKSIFDKNQVDDKKLNILLSQMYNDSFHNITKEKANEPITANAKKEAKYRQIREENVDLPFVYDRLPQQKHDFFVKHFKIQEKVATKHKQKNEIYTVSLHSHKRHGLNGTKHVPYSAGTNDFYWIHIPDTTLFYIIPEIDLINHNYIQTETQSGNRFLCISLQNRIKWYQQYQFDYKKHNPKQIKDIFNINQGKQVGTTPQFHIDTSNMTEKYEGVE